MKKIKIHDLLAIFAFSLGIIGFSSSQAHAETLDRTGWPAHLRFLTGPSGGQWFMLGAPIAKILSQNVITTSNRMGGGLSNIASVNSRLGDLGFTLMSFQGAAYSGMKEYAAIKADNAVLMAKVYPQVLYFLIRKDVARTHGITDVASLLQKKVPLRFASLKPGTASEFILTLLLKHGYDTSFKKLRDQGWIITFNNYDDTADSFVSGALDCFAYTAGTAVPLIRTMEQYTDVMILPIDKEVLTKLADTFKTGIYTIQPGQYKSITSPVQTLGDYTSIIVRRDLPDSLVFSLSKALWENKDRIGETIEDFRALSPDTALPEGIPVHPGAVKYWHSLRPPADSH